MKIPQKSLIQTIGRAARNSDGYVIMYADEVTPSMEQAIRETERRRKIQSEYNEKNNIVPKTINKKVTEILEISQKSNGNKKDSYASLSKKEKEIILKDLSKEMKLAAQMLELHRARGTPRPCLPAV